MQAEHETAGLPWGSPGERVDRLRRTVEELERLLESDDYQPHPVQKRVPLLIGGNGDRMLRLTAEHADIAAFTAARTRDGGSLEATTAEELEERVALYRKLAAGRAEPAELNLLVQIVTVTDDPGAAIQPWLPHIPHLTEQQVLELQIVLVGTLDEIVEKVLAQRERYGFSYLTVLEPNMEAFAPVVARLRGV